MGAVCRAANSLESRRRRDSDITCLAGGRRPLTRKLDSDRAATRTAPPRLGDDHLISDKDTARRQREPTLLSPWDQRTVKGRSLAHEGEELSNESEEKQKTTIGAGPSRLPKMHHDPE